MLVERVVTVGGDAPVAADLMLAGLQEEELRTSSHAKGGRTVLTYEDSQAGNLVAARGGEGLRSSGSAERRPRLVGRGKESVPDAGGDLLREETHSLEVLLSFSAE